MKLFEKIYNLTNKLKKHISCDKITINELLSKIEGKGYNKRTGELTVDIIIPKNTRITL